MRSSILGDPAEQLRPENGPNGGDPLLLQKIRSEDSLHLVVSELEAVVEAVQVLEKQQENAHETSNVR